MSDHIENLLLEAAANEQFERMKKHAWKLVWKRRKASVLMLPLATALVLVGASASVVPASVLVGAVLVHTLASAWALALGRVQTYMLLRQAAKMAESIAEGMDVPIPEQIQEMLRGPEFPSPDDY